MVYYDYLGIFNFLGEFQHISYAILEFCAPKGCPEFSGPATLALKPFGHRR